MAQLVDHVHVAKLIGVVTIGAPLLLVLQFYENGSLLSCLKEKKLPGQDLTLKGYSSPSELTTARLALEIAQGMAHIAKALFVHRDLAARNVLLDSDFVCKIAGFGLSRGVKAGHLDNEEEHYYSFPVRWTDPEALQNLEFTGKSDVWSFGVVLMEIVQGGKRPYHHLDKNDDVMKAVIRGQTAPRPRKGCTGALYDVISRCWQYLPKNRPTFEQLIPDLLFGCQLAAAPAATIAQMIAAKQVKASGGSGGSSATAPAKAAVAAAPFAVPAAQLKKTNKLVAKSALDNLVRSCNPRIIQDIFKDDLEFNGTVTCVGHHPGLGLQAAERLLESLLNVSGDFLTWDSGGSSPMAGIAACGVRVGQALPAQKKVRTRPNGGKFVGKIELGKPVQAALGLADLMGHTAMSIMQLINAHGGDGVRAIKQEIADHGSDDDKMNLRCLLDGTYVNPPHEDGTDPTPLEIAARSQTIETLMTMHQVTTAKLEAAHVLALRLYTTTSHKSINAPLRDTRSAHPLAATTYYISEGLKKLRAAEVSSPDANTPKTFWRGLKNREIGSEFISKGGCEFGCMSTSAFKNVAVEFALTTVPFLFQIETKDFLQRGADISFLSVYPDEQEMLYPPLTFLRSLRTAPTIEKIDGYHVQIVVVEPQFPT